MKVGLRLLSTLAIGMGLALAAPPAHAATADTAFTSYFLPTIDTKTWYMANGFVDGSWVNCEWMNKSLVQTGGALQMQVTSMTPGLRNVSCPKINTLKFHGYGRYVIKLQTAAGSGLNTAFFSYTGPPYGNPAHDEVDMEFLGKTPTAVSLGYWANGVYVSMGNVNLGFNASSALHYYEYDWSKDSIAWYADGKLLAKTAPGAKLPSNPGPLFVDVWAGAPVEDSWMGHFTYSKPVSAYVAVVAFQPYN